MMPRRYDMATMAGIMDTPPCHDAIPSIYCQRPPGEQQPTRAFFPSYPSSPSLQSSPEPSVRGDMGTCMSLSKECTPVDGGPKMGEASSGLGGGSGRSSKRWKWVGGSESISRRFGLRGRRRRRSEEEGGSQQDDQQQEKRMVVLNGATGVACLFTQQGRKGPNQDAMVVWEAFGSRDDTIFCGVFDGHGPYGHLVAKKVRDSLPVKLCNQWKAINDGNSAPNQKCTLGGTMNSEDNAFINLDDEWVESHDSSDSEKFPEIYMTLRQSLLKAFKSMDKELKLHPKIDCFCSGSTAVSLIKQGPDLIIGNIGDSRAVLGTRDINNTLVAMQLTVDLKPNLPREAARIQQCRGRVFALEDEPDVPRVWLPDGDSPGLAMARAFGDFCLKDYGLISVPDISYRKLNDHDEFIILATDGVWDVLSNKEVVDIVASAPTRSIAARMLVDCATREWRLKFPTSKIDDCAVICLFLKHAPGSPQMPKESVETTQDLADAGDMPQLPDDPQAQGNAMQEMFPPVGVDETETIGGLEDDTSTEEDIKGSTSEEWTALDGVTRVNTLLNVPRFQSGDARL